MKKLLATICLLIISSTGHAASGVGEVAGLSDSGLKQFQCTIEVQQMDPKTGVLGPKGSTTSIVLAVDETSAKAASINKLELYGPFEGSLFYQTQDRRQFGISAIRCH